MYKYFVLGAATFLLSADARAYTCSLKYVKPTQFQVDPATLVQEHQQPQQPQLRRSLGEEPSSSTGALVVPSSRRRADDISDFVYPYDTNGKATTTAYEDIPSFEYRLCDCHMRRADTEDSFYCPMELDSCTLFSKWWSDDFRFICFKTGVAVEITRTMWYYTCFAVLIFVTCLFTSRHGHHALKYVVGLCFPKLNRWITERILEHEIERRLRLRDELLNAIHERRRTSGWVTGYKLRTKRFVHSNSNSYSNSGDDDSRAKEDRTTMIGALAAGDDGAQSSSTTKEMASDEGKATNGMKEEQMEDDEFLCSICLLGLEGGDRIADLKCGHFYHAECLSEWIKKKNCCPLCQATDVAEEVRSFEVEDPASLAATLDNDSSSNGSRIVRYRRWAVGKISDTVIGRKLSSSGNRHRAHHAL